MNANDHACPPVELLQSLACDKLDALRAASIRQHVETCAACRLVVDGLGESDGAAETLLPGTAQTYVLDTSPPDALHSFSGWSSGDRPTGSPILTDHQTGNACAQQLAAHPDYEFVRELGRGGMGVVCLVRNRVLDRPEVLKILSRSAADHPGAVERLQHDIRLAARLNHPHIAATYNLFWLGELQALSMEYVAGQNLLQVVAQRGPLPAGNAALYVYQAALGLDHAHQRGMLHRDLRPAQLMLAVEGNQAVVKILEFGLSQSASQRAIEGSLTANGEQLSEPFDCIAPEYTLGSGQADIRADIYSLGCTLYYLLAGRPPFRGDRLSEILHAHHCAEAPPLNTMRPDVSDRLTEVVRKMMAKHPAGRYQTPRDVARDLELFLGEESRSATREVAIGLDRPALTPSLVPMAPPLRAQAVAVAPPLVIASQAHRTLTRRRRSSLPLTGACLLLGLLAWIGASMNSGPVEDAIEAEISEPPTKGGSIAPQAAVVRDVAGLRARLSLPEDTDKTPVEPPREKASDAGAGSQKQPPVVRVPQSPAPVLAAPKPGATPRTSPAAPRSTTLQPKLDSLRRDYAARIRQSAKNRESLAAISRQRLAALRDLAAEGERATSPDHRTLASIYTDLKQWNQVVQHTAKASQRSGADEQLCGQQIHALLSLNDLAGAERAWASARAVLSESAPLAALESQIAQAQAKQLLREEKLDAAEQVLQAAREKLALMRKAFSASSALWDTREQSLDATAEQIKSVRRRFALIGQPAIPLVADAWVNTTRLSDNDLRGKVVLLDFFAVWCGPCISTFPHLKHWREEYGSQGLVIVGVTNYYQFGWDAIGKHSKQVSDLSHSAEAKALHEFLKHHELQHAVAMMDNHDFASHYMVGGIPHAVIIDRAGKVRMMRIGSGEKNAEDLERCLRECLAERPLRAVSQP